MFETWFDPERVGQHHRRSRSSSADVKKRLLFGEALSLALSAHSQAEVVRIAMEEGFGEAYVVRSLKLFERFGTRPDERLLTLPMAVLRLLVESKWTDEEIAVLLGKIERKELVPTYPALEQIVVRTPKILPPEGACGNMMVRMAHDRVAHIRELFSEMQERLRQEEQQLVFLLEQETV